MHTYRAECFGQFMLTDGEVTLTQEEMRSDRLLNLLSFLIVNRKRNPSIEEIGNAVCGEDSEQSGASVIKNLVWRMRKLLKSKWPDEQFILTFRGGYKLNPELKVTTDYEEMEDLIQRAGQSEVVEEKAALLNQAFETYKGRFLVGCETERWAANLAVYYQNGAVAVAKRLAALYESLGAYEEVERVVHRATAEDALDEALWTILIRSYGEAGKMQKAEETFHQVSDSLYNALGIGPSPELSGAYQSALNQMHSDVAGVETVMKQFDETDEPAGAFFCEIGVFRKIYKLSARRISRFGFPVHMALITLDLKEGKTGADANAVIDQGMTLMKDCILHTLRTGDVVARYSRTQFVVLLPACQYETGEAAINRVFARFDKHKESKRYRRYFTLREMSGTAKATAFPAHNMDSASALRVCVDAVEAGGDFSGHITGVAVRTPVHFKSAVAFIRAVNTILDELGRPQANAILRTFKTGKNEEAPTSWQYAPAVYHSAKAIQQDTGALKTLDILFVTRSNNTWQGTLYDDSGQEAAFSSELDLVAQMKKMTDQPQA
ncbi:MAG: hypothetical protein DUD26_06680 [Eubacteriaceae bacterium]|uniref:Bacterial transcriptional activator domain-containing protein n=1 Tax=Candidatus Pseudoramibacter fermentans TaxID=2594427 RepID=A0A6L5GPA1_9FIRM|nr:hypothetical protein [Candidatus Pseudoramibacter fermentans]RRF92450.1 MAG: hypothetical protein DUD26_06680 [Eubacteriaceae bacterium]